MSFLAYPTLFAFAAVLQPSQDPAEIAPPPSLQPGTVVERVTTADDPGQEYALYLPEDYGRVEREWPILFVLDPRGRAVPGIERFLPAAERHGYIVMSSYQSRSDTLVDVNYEALDALLLEAQRRFAIDMRRLYLAGMSGTAHAAWRFGQILEGNVAGVIAAAGGVQTSTQGPPGEARFAYYGITSTADFNYREVLSLEEHLLARGIDHRIEVFEGRHGWPPSEYTNRALEWMEFQAIKRGLAADQPMVIDEALANARETAAVAIDPLVRLRQQRDIVRDFHDLRDVSADAATLTTLEAGPEVAKRRRQEKRLANAEELATERAGRWLGNMQNRSRRPPTLRESMVTLRIAALQKRAADLVDRADATSAQRILENLYTNVAFYLPREFERSGDLDRVVRCLELAVEIFPTRLRALWLLAEANARSGRHAAALEALTRATSFGNVDLPRLESDPTWQELRGTPEWQALIRALQERTATD